MPLTPTEVLSKIVENRVAQTQLTSAITLRALSARGRMSTKTNTSIDWTVDMGGTAVAIEPVTADGANTETANTVPANLRIGRYRVKHQFPISRVDIAEAATRAPGELKDLFANHIDRGLNSIYRQINQMIFTADGSAASGEFVGLGKIHDDTYSYAGISPVTYPLWKTLKLTGAPAGNGRALTKNLLLDLEELLQVNESDYNLIVTSPNTAKKYNQLFDTVPGGGLSGDSSMASREVDLGHGSRTYNGAAILEDPMIPYGTMHFINTNDLDIYSFNMGAVTPQSQQEFKVVPALGLNVHVAELPSNNSAVQRFELFVLPQMRLFNRKSVAAVTDII